MHAVLKGALCWMGQHNVQTSYSIPDLNQLFERFYQNDTVPGVVDLPVHAEAKDV